MSVDLVNQHNQHHDGMSPCNPERFLLKLIAAAVVSAALIPATALAVDPTVAGNTSIGTHPSYGSPYSGFWRNGSDYSVLTDGTNTFLNAPLANGTLYFRGHNTASPAAGGSGARMYLDSASNLVVGGAVYVNSAPFAGADPVLMNASLAASSGAAIHGISTYNTTTLDVAGVQGTALRGVGVIGNSTLGWGGMFGQDADEYYDEGIFVAGMKQAMLVLGVSNFSGDVTISNPAAIGFGGTGSLTVAGTASKPGGGLWAATSDVRVKKDITDFNVGLSDLEKVHVVKYKYNGLGGMPNNNTEYVGVVAQELEKVLPFMVSSQKKKLRESDAATVDLKQVDPSAFTYMLVNSVKELAGQNRKMAAQSAEQSKQIVGLMEQNKKLASLAEQNKQLAARNTEQDKKLAQLIAQNEKLAEVVAQNKALVSLVEQRFGVQAVASSK